MDLATIISIGQHDYEKIFGSQSNHSPELKELGLSVRHDFFQRLQCEKSGSVRLESYFKVLVRTYIHI